MPDAALLRGWQITSPKRFCKRLCCITSLQHISTSLQHSFPSLLCNLSSPTLLPTTRLSGNDTFLQDLLQHFSTTTPTWLYNALLWHLCTTHFVTLLYNTLPSTSLQNSSQRFHICTLSDSALQHSVQHFSTQPFPTLEHPGGQNISRSVVAMLFWRTTSSEMY